MATRFRMVDEPVPEGTPLPGSAAVVGAAAIPGTTWWRMAKRQAVEAKFGSPYGKRMADLWKPNAVNKGLLGE
jgi:hypothetical protein